LFHKKTQKIFCRNLLALIFALPIKKREIKGSLSADGGICHPKLGLKYWEFSSAGSEHLPYKQRVGGSIPSTPTKLKPQHLLGLFLLMKLWEFIRRRRNLPYKQRVGGSIPSTPTKLKPQHLLGLFLLMKLWEFIRRRRNLPYKQRVGGSIPSTPTAAVKGFSRLG
jgi:hypothetical protein